MSNPLLSRVTTVLSSAHADAEFRQTLASLDERATSHDAGSRRQLRLQLQREVIDYDGIIVDEFGKIADANLDRIQQLRRIGLTIERLRKGFYSSTAQISQARAQGESTLRDGYALLSQKNDIDTSQRLLVAVQDRFLLSGDETAALTLLAEPVDDRFFIALAKTKRIAKDCTLLLGLENQNLGLELAEQVSKTLNSAYQKLYKWTQKQFQTVNIDDPMMNSSIRRALRVLAGKPSLFQNCLVYFSDARDRALYDSFVIALEGPASGGPSRPEGNPIDMAAHDPLRHAGDMLAWAHSATVGEREALETLFIADGDEIAQVLKTGKQDELWYLAEDGGEPSDFDPLNALAELVNRSLAGVIRLLRQRLEQAVRSNEDIIMAYKLANLLQFYQDTFAKLLGAESAMRDALRAVEDEAFRQFRYLVRDHISSIQPDFRLRPVDMRPPVFLLDSLEQLKSIMDTYESSVASDSSETEYDFRPILDAAFEPIMQGCELAAETLPSPERRIFLVNCHMAAVAALRSHACAKSRTTQLLDSLSKEVSSLVDLHYVSLRRGSGFDDIFNAMQNSAGSDSSGPRGWLSVASRDELALASSILDNFLPYALMDATEMLQPVQDPGVRKDIIERAAERFCIDYAQLESYLETSIRSKHDVPQSSDGDEIRNILPRAAGEVRVLLS